MHSFVVGLKRKLCVLSRTLNGNRTINSISVFNDRYILLLYIARKTAAVTRHAHVYHIYVYCRKRCLSVILFLGRREKYTLIIVGDKTGGSTSFVCTLACLPGPTGDFWRTYIRSAQFTPKRCRHRVYTLNAYVEIRVRVRVRHEGRPVRKKKKIKKNTAK